MDRIYGKGWKEGGGERGRDETRRDERRDETGRGEGNGGEGRGREGKVEAGEEKGRACRLQGIKTCEIYSGTDWSGLARFGVASTKKSGGRGEEEGAILLVTSKEGARWT